MLIYDHTRLVKDDRMSNIESEYLRGLIAHKFGTAEIPDSTGLHPARFSSMVAHHRLDTALLSCSGILPPDIAAAQLKRAQNSIIASMRLGRELGIIFDAAQRAGLPLLAIKGPAFAMILGQGMERPSRDLDLLVRPIDRPRAARLLHDLGYQVAEVHWNAVEWQCRQRGMIVELHERLNDHDLQLPAHVIQPFETARTIEIGGRMIPTLDTAPALVFAAYHGARHLWRRWFWLVDFAHALGNQEIDWPKVADLADRCGVRRALDLTLALVNDMFGIAATYVPLRLSAEKAATLGDWPHLRAQVRDCRIGSDLDAKRAFGLIRFVRWHLSLHDGLPAKWATLGIYLRPSEADFEFCRLPGPLSFGYPIVRMIRVLSNDLGRR